MSTEKLSELSKPVAYSLRFRNMNGKPDKTINANTTFSTLEKAKAYGLGNRYVTQDDGKIVCVRDQSQDPIVEPLYSQEYVSALLAELEKKDHCHRTHAARLINERGALRERAEAAEQRIAVLEAKLATPVRLLGEMLLHDWEHSVERQATFQHRKIAWDARLAEDKKAILAAGFTFTVEGDA